MTILGVQIEKQNKKKEAGNGFCSSQSVRVCQLTFLPAFCNRCNFFKHFARLRVYRPSIDCYPMHFHPFLFCFPWTFNEIENRVTSLLLAIYTSKHLNDFFFACVRMLTVRTFTQKRDLISYLDAMTFGCIKYNRQNARCYMFIIVFLSLLYS